MIPSKTRRDILETTISTITYRSIAFCPPLATDSELQAYVWALQNLTAALQTQLTDYTEALAHEAEADRQAKQTEADQLAALTGGINETPVL